MINIDETRNSFIEEINQNELMSKKHKEVCRIFNHTYHLLILNSTVAGCVFSYTFALVGILIGITISTIALNICEITAGIKKYRSIIKKKKKKHDKIVLLENLS